MSEFAFFRFRSNNLLTIEEERHKDEIVELTEEALDAKGIECDSKVSKMKRKSHISNNGHISNRGVRIL